MGLLRKFKISQTTYFQTIINGRKTTSTMKFKTGFEDLSYQEIYP